MTYLSNRFHVLVLSSSLALLTACGGGGGGNSYYSPPSSVSSASSTVVSSLNSSTASSVSSVVPSSLSSSSLNSSSLSSSSSNSSSSNSSSSSSVDALVPPVKLVDPLTNAADGDYFVAAGEVSVGMPEAGGNTSFTAQSLDREGFSLYIFANDTAGVSNCNGNCLVSWPPLLANPTDVAEPPYSIIERGMGTAGTALQWAYQGKPLYFFKNDTVAGQTLGKAIANWELARPIPTIVSANVTLGSHLVAAGTVKVAAPEGGVEKVTSQLRQGFALYTFDDDTSGVSNCLEGCLANWPALIAHAGAVATPPYSLVTRGSGEQQWALNGMPLYFFVGDTAAGQFNGEGIGNKWHVARSAPVAVSNHPTEGRLFVAHGNIVNNSGAADNSRLDFTVYTFDQDTAGSGVSTCTEADGCSATWPPLFAPSDAQDFGDFTVITRDADTGVKQWAYKGQPLYFFVSDSAVGQTAGEYGDWHIARP